MSTAVDRRNIPTASYLETRLMSSRTKALNTHGVPQHYTRDLTHSSANQHANTIHTRGERSSAVLLRLKDTEKSKRRPCMRELLL